MKHLNMQSMDKVVANIEKIKELFPSCVTERINAEGKLEHALDFDMLKQELSDHVVDGLQERYQFTWPDKRKSILAANAPINKTLRPCREESVDFDNTENLYIEGDNLEVLKLLQETYLGMVKMIYIDPPYNTGNDFVYRDDFKQNVDEYVENSGQLDDEGNRMVANTESNGRFHTDWLNMMYPRLKLAKDLLSDDGVIFISIDDNEQENLKKICDEIFGESNFVADLIWSNKEGGGSSDSKLFRIKHEHIICYSKTIDNLKIIGIPISNADRYKGKDEYFTERGAYYLQKLGMGSIQYSKALDYPIETPDGTFVSPSDNNGGKRACWRWSKDKFEKNLSQGFVVIKKDSNNIWTVYTKQYMNCDNNGNLINRTQRPMGIIDEFSSTQAAKYLLSIGIATFNYSKPKELIAYLIKRIDLKESIILDFFSGSATTAHAVMQINAEDGGKRKFIMVQLPEVCAEDSEAYKAGYKNICEIGKERIRRAGKKIKEENPLTTQDLDIGFRVLKCDSSNMEDVYYTPKEYMNKQQDLFADNIKPDRSDEDLLFQVMLELDTPLSSKIEKTEIAGKTVYNVAQGHLMACFDKDVTDEVITAIAKEQPSYFVMRDSSLADDSVAINFEQIFNTYSPNTERRVL